MYYIHIHHLLRPVSTAGTYEEIPAVKTTPTTAQAIPPDSSGYDCTVNEAYVTVVRDQ